MATCRKNIFNLNEFMLKKLLFIDSEGGHGGSSHSLFALIYGIKQEFPCINIKVWCRLESNLIKSYKSIGVEVLQDKSLPKLAAVENLKGNLIDFIKFKLFIWPKSIYIRKNLLKEVNNYDLIHFNHESLFYLAAFIKKYSSIKISGHIRTICPTNYFSKLQMATYINSLDYISFISKNEFKHLQKLNIQNFTRYQICYNPVLLKNNIKAEKFILQTDGLKIAVLGNFSLDRGIDRVLSLAKKVPIKSNIKIIVIGDKIINENIPKSLRLDIKKGDDLAEVSSKLGLDNILKFVGYNENPSNIISVCDLVLRPSRTNSPWGRDIIEAFALKKPVIAIGEDNTFVKTGKTGILLNKYNEKIIIQHLIKLSNSPKTIKKMGANAYSLIYKLCNTKKVAKKMINFWSQSNFN